MSLFGSKNKVMLNVNGMTCGHCVGRVKNALEGVDGVKSAKVSLEAGDAEVQLKGDSIDKAKLIKAVEEAGYKASEK